MRLLLFVIAALLSGCTESLAENDPATVADNAIAMARGEVDVEGGVLHLSSPVDGVIENLPVEEGAEVKVGDTLAVLDHAAADLESKSALATLDSARTQVGLAESRAMYASRQLARVEQANADHAASPQLLDEARASDATAHAELQSARSAVSTAEVAVHAAELAISHREIRAPVSGRLAVRASKACVGCTIHQGEELFTVIPARPAVVRAQIDEDYVDRVYVGMAAEVSSDSRPEQRYAARVIRIGSILHRDDSDSQDERRDVRTLDCVLSIEAPRLVIGQRVLVQFLKGPDA